MRVNISIPVFVDGVAFPRKPLLESRSWIELADDADDHKFRVAFVTKDVKAVRDALAEEEEAGETIENGHPTKWRLTLRNDDPEEVVEPHDKLPPLRPHTIPGWWQVWSGGICIALLAPDDIKPVLDAAKP